VAVLLGLPSSVLFLQFFLKDVAVHLAYPYDRKLLKASSVSLDRLFIDSVLVGDLPSVMVFWGGPQSGTNHFRLELASYASLFSAFFVGSFQVRFALFSFRSWKDGLSFCPVETVRLILQGRGCLRLTQNAIFFSWMRLRVCWTLQPSIAAFLCCLLS
jgi:hypothetical protein